MPLKNMTRPQFLILSMIIIDGSIAYIVIFSNMRENLQFVGLMMFIASAFIVMFGALHIVKE